MRLPFTPSLQQTPVIEKLGWSTVGLLRVVKVWQVVAQGTYACCVMKSCMVHVQGCIEINLAVNVDMYAGMVCKCSSASLTD